MYFTSYYGKLKKLTKGGYTFASISNSKPDFLGESVLDWSFLGPWKDLLDGYKNGEISEEEYTKQYLDNLDKLWPGIESFMLLNYNRNIVMLCYEGPGKFCHRHILAEFLRKKGLECEEIN